MGRAKNSPFFTPPIIFPKTVLTWKGNKILKKKESEGLFHLNIENLNLKESLISASYSKQQSDQPWDFKKHQNIGNLNMKEDF